MNTGVSCHALLQGIFLIQGSHPGCDLHHVNASPALTGGFFSTSTTFFCFCEVLLLPLLSRFSRV